MKSLKSKTALITGAARGMGKSLAELLLAEGCQIALVDMDREALIETESQLSLNGRCKAFVCDITDESSVQNLAKEVEDALGPVSILVNNAGIVKAAPVTELTEKDVELIINVNLSALFRTCRIFIDQITSRGEGHIVNMASAGGILAIPNLSAYAATKFGVIGFSDALRQEMKKEGRSIGVTYVCPNTVNTGMFSGSKMVKGTSMLTPEKVAQQILKAIKKNKPLCAVPTLSLRVAIPLMKLILPINAMDSVCRSLGMWSINDSWKGRKDQETQKA